MPIPDPYSHRGVHSPDPYGHALSPLPRRAQPPTAIGTKSLKRLKNAQPLRPCGRAASLQEHERLVRSVVEWARFVDEGLEEWKR